MIKSPDECSVYIKHISQGEIFSFYLFVGYYIACLIDANAVK